MSKIQNGDTAVNLQAPRARVLSTTSPSFTSSESTSPRSLTDPLVQDLDCRSWRYLDYFASDVCKDFVLYDTPKHNPFRQLIPMAHHQPMLLQAIIASSALHMSNASQLLPSASSIFTTPASTENNPELVGSVLIGHTTSYPEAFHDALRAKQQALCLLNSSVGNLASANVDAILAAVLVLVGFELIDSGRGSWKFHINGARMIIEKLMASGSEKGTSFSPLRSWLVSNCLVYDLLGSSFANSYLPHGGELSMTTMSLLQDAEGNHCSSFPAALLPLIQAGAQLLNHNDVYMLQDTLNNPGQHDAIQLLHAAKSFDPAAWATDLQPRSPADDLHRTMVACAHRTAVCVYLSRIILAIWPSTVLPDDLQVLAAEVINHLSHLNPEDALFTATAWPAFIAGLETRDLVNRTWVERRFQELWKVEPWGFTREALGALRTIWGGSNSKIVLTSRDDELYEREDNGNWIERLKSLGTGWLIA
ncbi:hypothetical protein H9Q74_000411 [Fusarium xylarioides]|nr:hypothetical protein H9Q71_000395 [Fusarium xylarioides]KAG5829468.1 hypothetical protein H9Q74_000411 [Fusarium xylarioides]